MFINLNKLSDTNLACRKIAKDRNDSRQPSLSFFVYSLTRFQDRFEGSSKRKELQVLDAPPRL